MQKIYIFGLMLLLTSCTVPSDNYTPERKVTPRNNMIYSPGPKVQVSPVKAPSRPTTSRTTGRK